MNMQQVAFVHIHDHLLLFWIILVVFIVLLLYYNVF